MRTRRHRHHPPGRPTHRLRRHHHPHHPKRRHRLGRRPGHPHHPPRHPKALEARDQGCTHPGCGRPHRWCDAHHITHWAHGGGTNLNNLQLLCRRHHRIAHEQADRQSKRE
ncbi:MAG TPA: HNH endonuclease signature motif containing protein [Acidimicrobiia bacterium]